MDFSEYKVQKAIKELWKKREKKSFNKNKICELVTTSCSKFSWFINFQVHHLGSFGHKIYVNRSRLHVLSLPYSKILTAINVLNGLLKALNINLFSKHIWQTKNFWLIYPYKKKNFFIFGSPEKNHKKNFFLHLSLSFSEWYK